MDKTYNPQNIEGKWYANWEARGYFRPQGQVHGQIHGQSDAYCIMLPPPNVTGSLHMGHAFQQTLMDILIRYHRMQGKNTLWQCGTDHAGIATQMLVERQLEQQGSSRHELGREGFIQAVWDWKQNSGNTITRQSRRLGTSMDWSRERFTMDAGLCHAVQEAFIRLYDEGLIYRGKRLVNWDPVLHTAISDLEVIAEEEAGFMWHIRYPRRDGKGHIIVATTRPETMLGDAAVAVHPDDARYQALIGKTLALPLTARSIPVIADKHVDPAFGTGCLKITPAHDFNDYALGQRHGLEKINIFTIDAAMNDNCPAAYQGLDRYAARKQIVADLKTQGLLDKVAAHRLMVPRGDRSGAVIEPYLTDQWYVQIQPLAASAIKAVKDGAMRFIPDNWAKTYFDWMHNIEDWCISRQLWWGHRIPAWYDDAGTVYVGPDEAAVREKYQLGKDIRLKQDEDVLDTWFSSALWPFSTLGWPAQSSELKTFYPGSVLLTGFDIIFFWVARMIMLGLKFTGEVPFKEVYIHGLVRDAEGQKMSKSKGNILDPIDLIDGIDLDSLIQKRTRDLMQPRLAAGIEQATRRDFAGGIAAYGTDSLRFTFAALATQGRDIRFDVGRIGGYRNFCNKLWNATRYVLLRSEGDRIAAADQTIELGVAERWINSRLAQTIAAVRHALHDYRFDLAAQALHEYTWDEYCDWYLELSKTLLNDPHAPRAAIAATRLTLVRNLEILLRLLHPFMPFISEELWQKVAPLLGREGDTIMLQPYPTAEELETDQDAVQEIEWLKSFILALRRIRAARDIPPGKRLAVKIKGGSAQEQDWLARNTHYLKDLGRIASIAMSEREADNAVVALVGDMTLLVPLAELLDPAAEIKRLEKQLETLNNDRGRVAAKLANEDFISRAPAAVVKKQRGRLAEIDDALGRLQTQLDRIKDLAARLQAS